ncbi:hypothetical protein D5278_18305 [bacterium 1XD21-13]|nr:hypothetical protein [bacterium 1XD21-13]
MHAALIQMIFNGLFLDVCNKKCQLNFRYMRNAVSYFKLKEETSAGMKAPSLAKNSVHDY